MNKLKSMLKGDKKDSTPSHTSSQSNTTSQSQSTYQQPQSSSQQPQSQSSYQQPQSQSSYQQPQTSSTQQTQGAVVPEVPKGVLLTTSMGDITIALYADKTPRVSP